MNDQIREVMARVDRADFLPPAARRHAPYDLPIAIGHGQTNSQPYTVAFMLRLLDVHPGHRVLDVGAGSGWPTALLHELLDGTGHLTAVELVPELVEFGQSNLDAVGRDVTVEELREHYDAVIFATGAIADGIEAQAHQVFRNLTAVLQAAGSDMSRAVKTTVFIKNMDDFATVNAIYAEYFSEPFPARSCVEVARLPKDVLVECEVIAEA